MPSSGWGTEQVRCVVVSCVDGVKLAASRGCARERRVPAERSTGMTRLVDLHSKYAVVECWRYS